jgi:hypothetical protein
MLGIFYALGGSDILEGRLVNAPLQEKIRRSFSPGRSGNIHLVPNLSFVNIRYPPYAAVRNFRE